jgi:predicted amidohydrolase YtcJ
MRTIDDSGALAFGSDWPVSSGAPLDGIAVAISRRTVDGEPEGGWTPEEILTMDRALTAYTSAVAEQAFAGQANAPWGTIGVGASADLVWLDRDPRTTSALDVPAIAVRGTFLQGRRGHPTA